MPPESPKILTAVPVGFTPEGAVDARSSREILRFVAGSGVDGALVIGTTGEFVALDRAERRLLAEIALEELGPDTVVHIGAASAFEVLGLLDDARGLGATAVAVITPHFMPLTDAAVFDFFARIADASAGLRVYAYVFEARTGFAVSDELLGRIAALPNLVGAKISGEPVARLDGYRAAVPAAFELWTGSDKDLAVVPEHGGIGVVSGVASAFPEPFLALTRALQSGTEVDRATAQEQVDRVVSLTGGSPALLKEALRLRGIDAGHSRTPFPEITPAVTAELRRAVEECT
jgi:4-hydroxy-tetrahydrodipicolinate synthase